MSNCSSTFCWKTVFSPLYYLCSFVKDQLTEFTAGAISGLSILFNWSICQFFHQYHTFSINVAYRKFLKPGNVSPPTLIFSFNVVLTIQGLLPSFTVSLSISMKWLPVIFIRIALNPKIKLGRTDIFTILSFPTNKFRKNQW